MKLVELYVYASTRTDMNASCCTTRRMAGFRRGATVAGWVIPGTALLLAPKCPGCLAAYVALFTGVVLPFAVASWLHTGVIVVSAAALAWLTARVVWRWTSRRRRDAVHPYPGHPAPTELMQP
jgi:hypothetical protein